MEQLSLFGDVLKYKYIMDTSFILSQKSGERNRRTTFKGQWDYIDSLIADSVMVICSEIFDEIGDKDLVDWLAKLQCVKLGVDEDIQRNVIEVVTKKPELIEFNKVKSSGDAFLIATAMRYELIIVTEENKKSPKKIPQVAESLGVKSVNFVEFLELEGIIL
jgi:hypothetical protein